MNCTVLKYCNTLYNLYKKDSFLQFVIIENRLSPFMSATSVSRIQISFYVDITRERMREVRIIAIYVNS